MRSYHESAEECEIIFNLFSPDYRLHFSFNSLWFLFENILDH